MPKRHLAPSTVSHSKTYAQISQRAARVDVNKALDKNTITSDRATVALSSLHRQSHSSTDLQLNLREDVLEDAMGQVLQEEETAIEWNVFLKKCHRRQEKNYSIFYMTELYL